MKDQDKTKEQLIDEQKEMRERICVLEVSETERKRADEEIRKFKTTTDNAGYGVAIGSLDGILSYVNESFARMHGYTQDELVGRHYSILYTDEQKLVIDKLRDWLGQVGSFTCEEIWHKRKDGSLFPTLMTGNLIRDDRGNPSYIVGSTIDITERKQAENALKESEQRYIDAEKLSNIGHWRRYFNSSLSYWSAGLYRIFGVDPEHYEPWHQNSLQLFHPDDRERWEKMVENARLTGTSLDTELRIIRPNGDERSIHTIATVLFDNKGQPESLFGTTADITKRKQAEEALKESVEKFSRAFHSNPHSMSIATLEEGHYMDVNDSYVQTFGYSREELLGRTTADVGITKADRLRKRLLQLKEDKTLRNLEAEFYTKSGSKVDVLISADIMEIGNQTCLLSVITDITERKQAEEEIRKFKTISDRAGYGTAIASLEGQFIYVNDSYARMHGYEAENLIGKPWQMLYPEDQIVAIQALREQLMEKGGSWVREIWRRKKDGIIFPSLTTGMVINDDKGKPLYIAATAIDITERKKMEEKLQHSQVLASLGEMTAGISHEVNNPLASIILLSEVVLAGDMPRQTRRDIKVIQGEAKRAANIMRDLLTYSRRLQPRMRRVNLHGLIKKIIDMRRYQEKVHDINVSSNLLKGPLYVNGDSAQLTQVFINLVMNAEEALKESKEGKITVATRVDGERVKISITDNGTGIPEENLNQIFNPFFTTREVGRGTGLGLSTCYGIVTAHGGLIHAENNEKGGATFTVELPLAGKGRQGVLPLETGEIDS